MYIYNFNPTLYLLFKVCHMLSGTEKINKTDWVLSLIHVCIPSSLPKSS